jgi:Family of unknown function (DUF6348)
VRESHARLEYAASLVAARLNAMHFEWRAVGNFVEGPGTTAVTVAARHSLSPNHIDIGFVLDRTQPESHVIWDCSTGLLTDLNDALVQAIDVWAQVTAPVLLELMTRKGEFADHYHGDDSQGFAGWHAIGGALIAWGRGPGPDDLQRWALAHPLLPPLRDSVAAVVSSSGPVGLRLFFGASAQAGDTAEVQVDGVPAPEPSAVLASLPWPRHELAYLRTFALLIHPETQPSPEEIGNSFRDPDTT